MIDFIVSTLYHIFVFQCLVSVQLFPVDNTSHDTHTYKNNCYYFTVFFMWILLKHIQLHILIVRIFDIEWTVVLITFHLVIVEGRKSTIKNIE